MDDGLELEGTVAVVTGGASGIGRGTVLALASAGADVVVSDIHLVRAEEVRLAVEDVGRECLVVLGDLRERSEVEALVDRSIGWKGHVDVFVHNAGDAIHGPPERIPVEDWEWIVDLNVWPHVWATRLLLPHMIERGSGHLVHVASAAGLSGSGWYAPYVMSKHAVVGLAESTAIYCGGTGVGVSVVCPSYVTTNLGERSRMTFDEIVDDDTVEGLRDVYRTALEVEGLDPADVGSQIVEAVRSGRFWVLPHPEVFAMMASKWQDPEAWIRQRRAAWVEQRELYAWTDLSALA